MFVPGATISGRMRSSCVGPREEKAANPQGASEMVSSRVGLVGKLAPEGPSPYVPVYPCPARRLSTAPTARTFLAVAGL